MESLGAKKAVLLQLFVIQCFIIFSSHLCEASVPHHHHHKWKHKLKGHPSNSSRSLPPVDMKNRTDVVVAPPLPVADNNSSIPMDILESFSKDRSPVEAAPTAVPVNSNQTVNSVDMRNTTDISEDLNEAKTVIPVDISGPPTKDAGSLELTASESGAVFSNQSLPAVSSAAVDQGIPNDNSPITNPPDSNNMSSIPMDILEPFPSTKSSVDSASLPVVGTAQPSDSTGPVQAVDPPVATAADNNNSTTLSDNSGSTTPVLNDTADTAKPSPVDSTASLPVAAAAQTSNATGSLPAVDPLVATAADGKNNSTTLSDSTASGVPAITNTNTHNDTSGHAEAQTFVSSSLNKSVPAMPVITLAESTQNESITSVSSVQQVPQVPEAVQSNSSESAPQIDTSMASVNNISTGNSSAVGNTSLSSSSSTNVSMSHGRYMLSPGSTTKSHQKLRRVVEDDKDKGTRIASLRKRSPTAPPVVIPFAPTPGQFKPNDDNDDNDSDKSREVITKPPLSWITKAVDFFAAHKLVFIISGSSLFVLIIALHITLKRRGGSGICMRSSYAKKALADTDYYPITTTKSKPKSITKSQQNETPKEPSLVGQRSSQPSSRRMKYQPSTRTDSTTNQVSRESTIRTTNQTVATTTTTPTKAKAPPKQPEPKRIISESAEFQPCELSQTAPGSAVIPKAVVLERDENARISPPTPLLPLLPDLSWSETFIPVNRSHATEAKCTVSSQRGSSVKQDDDDYWDE
eukprot:GILK01003484.1.p1 GENE.GILK01003484.1~~GILK01003484.1.p1  ORF type:complete len:746 (+),score=140.50 GILK01003484.1:73-2310(+)